MKVTKLPAATPADPTVGPLGIIQTRRVRRVAPITVAELSGVKSAVDSEPRDLVREVLGESLARWADEIATGKLGGPEIGFRVAAVKAARYDDDALEALDGLPLPTFE